MPRSGSRSRSPRPRDDNRYRDRRRDRSRSRDRDSDRKDRRKDRARDTSSDRRRPRGSRDPDSSKPKRRSRSRSPGRRPPRREDDSRKEREPRSRRDDYSPPPQSADPDGPPPAEKQKPNFANTGLLAAASNTVNNVALKYAEPGDSRKPPPHPAWKLFIFKDAKVVETIDISTRSCWLIGRDRAVADLPVDHPSCSKQHAVLQWRYVVKTNEHGEKKGKVRLYMMDLESANGTKLGDVEIEGGRYVEVLEGDLIRFGMSTREYVVMVEKD